MFSSAKCRLVYLMQSVLQAVYMHQSMLGKQLRPDPHVKGHTVFMAPPQVESGNPVVVALPRVMLPMLQSVLGKQLFRTLLFGRVLVKQ